MDVLSDTINNEIKPGETILWKGHPDPGIFLKKAWKLPAIVILLSIGLLLQINERGGSLLSGRAIIWWALIVIAVQGMWRAYHRIKKQCYVLTNQRAIVFMISPRPVITSQSKENMAAYTKTSNSDGSGNIIFTGGRKGLGSFVWLKDMKTVSDMIDKVIAGK